MIANFTNSAYFVGAAGVEPALFTIMDEIYSLARHHHRRCTPKFDQMFLLPGNLTEADRATEAA